VAGYIRCHSEF